MPDTSHMSAALAEALKQAKTAKMHFALVLKGAADGELLVAKAKIPPTQIGEAKKRSGGSKVVVGMCQAEDGSLVFETDEAPAPTWDNAVKLIAKRDAGATIHPQFRQILSASSSTAPQQQSTQAAAKPSAPGPQQVPGAPPSPPPHGHAQQSDWQQALHAIEPSLVKALKENRGDTAKMRAVFALARQKADAGAYDVALQALHSLEQLIDHAASAPPAPSAPPQSAGGPAPSAANVEESNYVSGLSPPDADSTSPYVENISPESESDEESEEESEEESDEDWDKESDEEKPRQPQGASAGPGQPPAPPKGSPPAPKPKPNAPAAAPQTDYSRWRDRAQALDGYINRFTGFLNELTGARAAYESEYAKLQDWSRNSYQELTVVVDMMFKRIEGKDSSQLDPATQQSLDLIHSLTQAAHNPEEFAKCSARFDPPRADSSREQFQQQQSDSDQLAVLKLKQRRLREVADGSAEELKSAHMRFDELCQQKNLTAEIDALTAASQAALEGFDRATGEQRAAVLEWDEARQAWDTAGQAANQAAALVKKLAAENAPQNQQAAARQQAESAAQSLTQARAASEQAGAVVSEKNQLQYQAGCAAGQAEQAVDQAKNELRGRVGGFLVRAEQNAATTEFDARTVEDAIAQLQLKQALDETQLFKENPLITLDDRKKMRAFFAKLKLAEPIRDELRKCAGQFDAVLSQVKGTKVAGLGVSEGVVVQLYLMNFGKYCDKVRLYASEQWSMSTIDQEAEFDPSDLSALRQARSAMNSEPGAPLNR